MKKAFSVFSVLLLVSLVLVTCGPQATPTAEVPTAPTSAPQSEATKVPEATQAAAPTTAPATETKLVVWDQFYRGVESQVMDTLDKEFEANHPGVKIERVAKTLDDLKVTLKLAMSQTDGPDVAQVNQGRSDMGAMVQGGLLLPLNDYSAKYKWTDKFSSSVLNRNSFTEDGKTFGTGNLYGVSPTGEVVGVYYNKDLFEKNGWKVPTTFDEFQALLAQIKAAGVTPIAFGDLDGWPGIHEFSSVQHLLVTPQYMNDFVYGVNNVSFDTPENQEAAKTMQDWVDKGYFTDGFLGIGYDDVTKLFKDGKAAMSITGSWLAGELISDTSYKFGFFLMPQKTADAKAYAIGGVGIPFAIRKTTANPDLAAEYLDFMVSDRAAQIWADSSIIPAMPLPADYKIESGSIFGDTVAAWNKVNTDNGVGHYIDWASPTIYDTLNAELQKLFAKKTDPATFTANVEKDYSTFLTGQK